MQAMRPHVLGIDDGPFPDRNKLPAILALLTYSYLNEVATRQGNHTGRGVPGRPSELARYVFL